MDALLLMNAGELEPARQINRSLLEGQPTANIERAVLLNNIAYADALLGTNLDEADRLSQEALAIAPWIRALKNTRGTVLMALGRLDEALPLLLCGLPKPEDLPGNSGQYHCILAMAEARYNQIETAVQTLEIARAAEPGCFLIPKAEAAIAAARAQAGRSAALPA